MRLREVKGTSLGHGRVTGRASTEAQTPAYATKLLLMRKESRAHEANTPISPTFSHLLLLPGL